MPIPQVQYLMKTLAMSRSRFLYGLDRTADDRLNWSPGGAAATPLQLAGKAALFAGAMAHILQNRSMPDRQGGMPPPPASREEAKAAVDAAYERLRSVIAGLTEGD